MYETTLQLIENDLGPARRRSGRWSFWPCPFHDDKTPSLGVTRDNDRWHCFGCGKGGDARTWLWLYRRQKTPRREFPPSAPLLAPSQPSALDNPDWQDWAAICIQRWEDTLWSAQGKTARWYLYGRGLNGDILRKYHIGCNSHDYWDHLKRWGLSPRDEKDRKLYLPAGISIPWIVEERVWKINFRRLEGKTPKYLQLRGSQSNGLFGVQSLPGKPVIFIVEGEFDALLLEQFAGDLAGVCTLGSASHHRLDERWLGQFLGCCKIILVGDNDPAGQAWAEGLGALSARMRRASVPRGKDITEFWHKGGDLREWVINVME